MTIANQAQAAELVAQMRKLLDGVDIFTGMAALQHVTIDVLMQIGAPKSEECVLDGLGAIAADMHNQILARFASGETNCAH